MMSPLQLPKTCCFWHNLFPKKINIVSVRLSKQVVKHVKIGQKLNNCNQINVCYIFYKSLFSLLPPVKKDITPKKRHKFFKKQNIFFQQ